jgi:hypothetical protein
MDPGTPARPPEGSATPRPASAAQAPPSGWSYIGVGCFTVPIGFFGGGMIAVLIAKIVGAARNCTPPEGLPACNTFEFLLPGALIGLIALPALAVLRLRKGRRSPAAPK